MKHMPEKPGKLSEREALSHPVHTINEDNTIHFFTAFVWGVHSPEILLFKKHSANAIH